MSSLLAALLGLTLAADPPPIQRPTGMLAPRSYAAAAPVHEPAAPPPSAPAIQPSAPAPIATTPTPSPATAPTPDAAAPAAPEGDASDGVATHDDATEDDPTAAPEHAPRPRGDASEGTGRNSAGALRRRHDEDVEFPHRGFVADFLVGPMGCVRGMCGDDRHAISPGVRLSGFIGGNIRGWVELGLGGGWGSMRSQAAPGTNALLLYGLDPFLLQQALSAAAGGLLKVDLTGLATTRVRMQTAQVGPMARINFIPRGRAIAWAGAGIDYHLLRNKYDTASGPVRMDFHGLAVPIEAAVGVYVHRNIALTAQFDYLWTWYGLAVLDHPDQRSAIPVTVLQSAAQLQGVDIRGELPQFWTVGVGLRGRL